MKEVEQTLERSDRLERRNNILIRGLQIEQRYNEKERVTDFIQGIAGRVTESLKVRGWRTKKANMYLAGIGGKKAEFFVKKRGRRKRRQTGTEERVEVDFWNIVGLGRKDEDFWEYIKEKDIMFLMETWVQENNWEKMARKLPKEFEWKAQHAERTKTRERGSGGMVVGVRKGIECSIVEMDGGLMQLKTSMGGREIWRMVGVYNRKHEIRLLEKLEREIGETEEECLMIGGDFNGRIGKGGGVYWREEVREERRNTKDKRMNKEGDQLIELVESQAWRSLNGNKEGDYTGDLTYVGERGGTVIDYGIANEGEWNMVKGFKIRERTETEHMPLEIGITGEKIVSRREEESAIEVDDRSEEVTKKYREKMEKVKYDKEGVEERLMELILKIGMSKKSIRFTRRPRAEGAGTWWNRECRESKKKI